MKTKMLNICKNVKCKIFCFQTKFVENSSRIITPPFMFEYGRPRTVIAFVEDKELQQAALDAGAEAAGGVDLIKQV